MSGIKWVRVEDGLPETHEPVLVYGVRLMPDESPRVGIDSVYRRPVGHHGGSWNSFDVVTHWAYPDELDTPEGT
jgi:hypothetical protein